MAEYQSDDTAALQAAEAGGRALHHQASISHSDRDEEMSRIWRVRAVRAAHAGNQALADKSLKELEKLANSSRNRVIQSSYQGAAGTLLMDQKKYQEAIAHLEEDQENPFTMELLVQAYYQTIADREGARDRGQASRHECADDGAGFSGPGGALQAPNI